MNLNKIPPEIIAAFPRGPWRSKVDPTEANVTRIVQTDQPVRGTWVARILHNGEQMPVVQEAISAMFAVAPELFATEQQRQRIETDDAEAARIGAEIANVLGLQRTDQRYGTTLGRKTDAGLARLLLNILTGERPDKEDHQS